MGRTRQAAAITVLTLLVAACTDAEPEATISTTVTAPPATSTVSPGTIPPSTATAAAMTVFDERRESDVFALVEHREGGKLAQWNSAFIEPISLPDDVEAAVPDGRGGIVFTTNDEVWWQSDPGVQPLLIEQPGEAVSLIGLRHADGEPSVLVLIGDKFIGYDQGRGRLEYAFDQVDGDVVRLDFDGDRAALIVEKPQGLTAQVLTMTTGELIELVAPIEADLPDAPRQVAIADDRVVVLDGRSTAGVFTTGGDQVGTVNLGIEEMPLGSLDLVGTKLLAAFGEAVTVTDIDTGERYVVDLRGYWVLSASWADVPLPPTPDVAAIRRYRVNKTLVDADTADPFLNVRRGPSADHDLLAKLPSAYTGLRRTGEEATADDGAVWFEVELLDPVAVTPPEPLEGSPPIGWVNSNYLEPLPEGLPVTLEEVPGCVDDYTQVEATTGSRPADFVYAVESAYLSDSCLRVVLTFGSGDVPVDWEYATGVNRGPADSIPEVFETASGSIGSYVDLGGVESVWWGATETDDGVYIVDPARDGLEMWALQPAERTMLRAVPERGVLVLDMVVRDDVALPVTGPDVALTGQLTAGSEAVTVAGISRPFEGQLGVTIEDGSGAPVETVYSGSLVPGTIETSEYFVYLPDWYPAWRPFAAQAEGLAPGDYVMVLDAGGGADDSHPLRLPFTIEEPDYTGMPGWYDDFIGAPPLATEDEQDIVRSLIAFGTGEADLPGVPFADEVKLGLGTTFTWEVAGSRLADRDVWIAGTDFFAGYDGEFSALQTLARDEHPRVTVGPIPHCAGAPLEWPADFADWRQINVEPIVTDSCLQWSAVSIFLNADDEVAAVVIDLWEP